MISVWCAWIRPLLERMDLWEVLCEIILQNACFNKNELVAEYKLILVPSNRLFRFGNGTQLLNNKIKLTNTSEKSLVKCVLKIK